MADTDHVFCSGLTLTATPAAVAVAACDSTIVVPFVTDWIVVPAGMPAPEIALPTSAAVKPAVAEVSVVLPFVVAPSLKVRPADFVNVNVIGIAVPWASYTVGAVVSTVPGAASAGMLPPSFTVVVCAGGRI